MMSKDKYPIIFSLQMEAIVFIILQIFLATRAVLKIEGYYNKTTSPSFLRADSQRGAAELTIARRKRGRVV